MAFLIYAVLFFYLAIVSFIPPLRDLRSVFLFCFFLLVRLTPFPAGTSTDVSRYAGQYEHVFEATTAGVTLQAPQLDINTVAAGGGSRLFFR